MADNADTPKLLSIEGGLGAGKTTLMNLLRNSFAGDPRVVFVDEPVEMWERSGLLKAQYEEKLNPAVFQHGALMSRVGDIIEALRRKGVLLVITERSPFSDCAVFAKANLSGWDLINYEQTYIALLRALPLALDVNIAWLKADSDVLVSRVRKRNRDAEASTKTDYINRINDLHTTFFDTVKCNSKIIIMADNPEDAVHSALEKYAKSLLSTPTITTTETLPEPFTLHSLLLAIFAMFILISLLMIASFIGRPGECACHARTITTHDDMAAVCRQMGGVDDVSIGDS